MLTRRSPFIALLAVATGLLIQVGCAGGQFGEEGGIGCLPVETTPIALEDVSPIGFAAQDVIDATSASEVLDLRWADGSTAILQLDLDFVGPNEFHDREWIDDGDAVDLAAEPAPTECNDILSMPIALMVSTDDGALGESWTLPLQAHAEAYSTTTHTLQEASGSLDPTAFAPAGDYKVVDTWIDLTFRDGTWTGTISGMAESMSTGGGDDGVVSGMQFEIATIGPE